MTFDAAFDALIRRPLEAEGLTKDEVRARSRQGQLAADDDEVTALCGYYLHTRAHADCLVESLAHVKNQGVLSGDILLVDTGCGVTG